jgi:hypothetical protein
MYSAADYLEMIIIFCTTVYRVSQKWRTNYLLPYRGCLNVHEKNIEKNFQTKIFRQKFFFLLLLLLTVIQCKQRCTRTTLPCNVTVVDLK